MISLRRGQCIGWPLLLVMLAACSNGSGSLDEDQQPPPTSPAQTSVTIGGTVVGLAGGSVVLQNNGAGDLTITGDGPFTFAAPVANGASYEVLVLTQPTSPVQTCNVANGRGTAGSSNVTSVVVTCSTTPRYSVRANVTGLSGSVVLQNNEADDLVITSNGNYFFDTPLADGSTYNVRVITHPAGQSCGITNPTGVIAGANVTNVEVACVANQFTVGGTVKGLTNPDGKNPVVLQLNGTTNVQVLAAGSFVFPGTFPTGTTYDVKVLTNPVKPKQQCTVENPKGTVANANVGNIAVTCVTQTYAIGGTVANLAGTGLVLILNGTERMPIAPPGQGKFQFATKIASGSPYKIDVENPSGPSQKCVVDKPTGVIDALDVELKVTCSTNTFTVGGSVVGLLGKGLKLRINGWEEITLNTNPADRSFTFPTPVASGSTYTVEVTKNPDEPTQGCSISNPPEGRGTVPDGKVENIVVTCSTSEFAIGGSVSNLIGTGLVLGNGDDRISIARGATTFKMPRTVPSGGTYNVQVITNPESPKQECSVANPTGPVTNAEISSVVVSCRTIEYKVNVQISGLRSTLTLLNNEVDPLTVMSDGVFSFATSLPPGSAYNVRISATDPPQFCAVGNGFGTMGESDVTVTVSCLSPF